MKKKRFYRNLSDIKQIPDGSLWLRQGEIMILLDDDEFVSVAFEENMFREDTHVRLPHYRKEKD